MTGPRSDRCQVIRVGDAADDRLADYRALTDVDLRTKIEPPNGLFIAEGERVIRRALRAGYALRSVLMSPEWLERMAALVDDVDAPVYVAPADVLEQVTGFHVHRGALASVHRRPLPPWQQVVAGARRVVVLEEVVNHTNLGAIIRSAAALGMEAVLLSPSCADPLYRRSVRVSMGEVFAVPYARLQPWPGALDAVRAAGFTVLAMTPAADAVAMRDLTQPQRARAALMLGAEGSGLTRAALE